MKIGQQVLIKVSHGGELSFSDGEIVTLTEKNISFLECSIRGGLAEVIGETFQESGSQIQEKSSDIPETENDKESVILSNTSSRKRNAKSSDKSKG